MTVGERQRADEALDWVRCIHDPSFDDWEGHVAWLEADPYNSAAFDEASAMMDAATADLASPEPHIMAPVSANDNLAGLEVRHRRRRRWAAGLGMAVAAGIVAVITVPSIMPSRGQPYLIRTAAGEQRSIALDGSTIALNGGSRLRLDRADPRSAVLEAGEALFTVRHDAAHPFAVRAGDATFQDVGTVFDIVQREASTRIAVREGAVLYDPGGSAVRLGSGQSMRIASGAATVQTVDTAAVGAWQTGRLLYRDAPLSDVADEISRSIGEPITVDPTLSQRRFTGVVKIDADRSRMFRRIAAVMGVTIRRVRQGWQMVMPSR